MVAGGWDDFSNNLATDLTPLISLFGEQSTKQFLSESTTLTDLFIFSMAPIGVLTAVVSAIRAGGKSSLRAFIGRAQEGGASIEIELSSSTSRDVCEVFNDGGISRVFGRPKIIEFVQDMRATNEDFYNRKTAGLHLSKDYVPRERGQRDWKETTHDNTLRYRKKLGSQKAETPSGFAPNPNLTLNIGIKRPSFLWFIAAAIFGFLLQSAVLVFAALTTYQFQDQFKKDDAYVSDYAFPCTLTGTVFLGLGVGLCGYQVTRNSQQRVFRKQPGSSCRLFWVQPGNQVIGDQVFDSFAFIERHESPINEYTTKWKKIQSRKTSRSILVWVAIFLTLSGFVLQFLGLRALHSSVSIAQLGIMIVMSAVRAGLRTRRLDIEESPMSQDPEFYEDHELDWVAFEMGKPDILSSLCDNHATGSQSDADLSFIFQVNGHPRPVGTEVFKDPIHHDWEWSWYSHSQIEIQCLSIARGEAGDQDSLLGLFYNFSNSLYVRLEDDEIDRKMIKDCRVRLHGVKDEDIPRTIPRIILSRARLSEMTLGWGGKHAPTRESAIALKRAIEETADVVFDGSVPDPTTFEDGWKDVHTIFWSLDCKIMKSDTYARQNCRKSLQDSFFFKMSRTRPYAGLREGQWETDLSDLEAVLSMWVWSLRQTWQTTMEDSENSTNAKHSPEEIQCYRIISARSADACANLRVWFDFPNALGQRSFSYESTQKQFEPIFGHTSDGKPCWIFRNNSLDCWNSSHGYDGDDAARFSASLENATKMCAQEIYIAFFQALLHPVLDIGGGTQKPTIDDPFPENSRIKSLCDIFQQAGLGDREDAQSCILPALFSRHLLPSRHIAQQMASDVRNVGEQFQRNGNLISAEKCLRWSYFQCWSLAEGRTNQTLVDARTSTEARSSTESRSSENSRISTERTGTMTTPETHHDSSDNDECTNDSELHRSTKRLCECLVQQISGNGPYHILGYGYPEEIFFTIRELLQHNINLPQNWEIVAEFARTCLRILKDRGLYASSAETLESVEIIKRILSRNERRIDTSEIFIRGFGYVEEYPATRIR